MVTGCDVGKQHLVIFLVSFYVCVCVWAHLGCVSLFQELEGLLGNIMLLLHFVENSSANILSYYGI